MKLMKNDYIASASDGISFLAHPPPPQSTPPTPPFTERQPVAPGTMLGPQKWSLTIYGPAIRGPIIRPYPTQS